jgi:Di-haem cytochrome c peroxidase
MSMIFLVQPPATWRPYLPPLPKPPPKPASRVEPEPDWAGLASEEQRSEAIASTYAPLFEQVWGSGSLSAANVSLAYERIARSIAAYERSQEVNPFSSKFDAYLGNKVKLTRQEKDGFRLFLGKGNCLDSVCYRPRGGALVDWLFVRRDLERIFRKALFWSCSII